MDDKREDKKVKIIIRVYNTIIDTYTLQSYGPEGKTERSTDRSFKKKKRKKNFLTIQYNKIIKKLKYNKKINHQN